MSRRSWKQLEFHLPFSQQDFLIGQLSEQPCSGFVQEDEFLVCYIGLKHYNAGFRRVLTEAIERTAKAYPRTKISSKAKTVREQNWNKRWERSVGVVEVSDRLLIKPSWKSVRSGLRNKIVIQIDPKMSFGTGHHETTRLSLILLEKFMHPKTRILDFGTGTGILAIAAAKLGGRTILAYDNDEWSVENARENVKKNRVGRKVTIRFGDTIRPSERPFDLIAANIDFSSLRTLASQFRRFLKHHGILILSGILTRDLSPIIDLYTRKGLEPIELLSEGEWAAIALLHTHAPRRR